MYIINYGCNVTCFLWPAELCYMYYCFHGLYVMHTYTCTCTMLKEHALKLSRKKSYIDLKLHVYTCTCMCSSWSIFQTTFYKNRLLGFILKRSVMIQNDNTREIIGILFLQTKIKMQ